MRKPRYRPFAWLWWLLVLILAAGGGAWYYLQQQPQSLEVRQLTSIVILITSLGSGICLICATSGFWMKH